MAIGDFKPKGDLFTTVAVGVGVATAPLVVPLAWTAVRPLLKVVLKGGFMLYETGRGACAAAAEWTGAERAKEAPAVKPRKAEARTKETSEEQRALAQSLVLIEEQSTGKKAQKPARPKPKAAAKTAKKKPEERK